MRETESHTGRHSLQPGRERPRDSEGESKGEGEGDQPLELERPTSRNGLAVLYSLTAAVGRHARGCCSSTTSWNNPLVRRFFSAERVSHWPASALAADAMHRRRHGGGAFAAFLISRLVGHGSGETALLLALLRRAKGFSFLIL